MGIVNLTCDSFSGGGFMSAESAVEHALELLNDGADMLDIGAESTRPGSYAVAIITPTHSFCSPNLLAGVEHPC